MNPLFLVFNLCDDVLSDAAISAVGWLVSKIIKKNIQETLVSVLGDVKSLPWRLLY